MHVPLDERERERERVAEREGWRERERFPSKVIVAGGEQVIEH